ncbi:hypothetical protein PENSPDRAFT_650924 [Peniophora sp. CONT]|nr:hypothetical protein PENSPDRAFT_650924 [Peniophora sp. CONT]
MPHSLSSPNLNTELLNDDVLREIFDYVAYLEPYERHPFNHQLLHALGWIRLSHVCRKWRSLLLDMPTLWGRIALVSAGPPPRASGTFLSRSRNSLLDAEFSRGGSLRYSTAVHDRHRKRLMEAAKILAPRLRTLAAISVELPLDDLLYYFRHSPLPALRILRVVYSKADEDEVVEALQDDLIMDAPNLVEASFILFAYGLPMGNRLKKGLVLNFPSLRSFTVKWSEMDRTDATIEDLRWVTAAIRNAPRIEHLYLSLGLWHFDADWNYLFDGINAPLHHLKKLVITQRSMCMHTGDLLERICVSPPPSFTFTARYLFREDITPMMHALEPYLRSCASYSTLYIRFRHPSWVMLHILSNPDDARLLSEEKTFARRAEDKLAKIERQTTLSLSTPTDHLLSEELLPDLVPWLPVANLTYLHINGSVNPFGWWHTFTHLLGPQLTSVHTLVIDNLSWLAPKAAAMNALNILDPYTVSTPDPPLPALRTLSLSAWVTGTKGRNRVWLKYVLDLVERRKNKGLPLHVVRLRGGWMTSQLKMFWWSSDDALIGLMKADVVGDVIDERVVFETL